jgi:hypothetical protein
MAIMLGIAVFVLLYFIGQMALAFDAKMARRKSERAAVKERPKTVPISPPVKNDPVSKPVPISTPKKSPPPYTVMELLRRITALQAANAGWSEIIPALNPSNNSEARNALEHIRGPHMFIPHVGLNVIEEECRKIATHAPTAEWLTALTAASQTMRRIR